MAKGMEIDICDDKILGVMQRVFYSLSCKPDRRHKKYRPILLSEFEAQEKDE